MHKLHRAVVVALLATATLSTQTPLDQSKAEEAPKRIHVIGASVSGGFEDGPLTGAKEQGDTIPLHVVLKQWADGEVRVSTHPPMQMCMLFMDPDEKGSQMIALAKKKKADIIVAADFMFWFAYGWVLGDQLQGRSQRFQRGLKMLEEFQVPVLVGDLPDMTGASTRLLRPAMIPPLNVQAALNKQLTEWANARPNMTIVPLAQVVKQLKDVGVELPLTEGKIKTPPCALLQADHLHVNRLGMAFLMSRLQDPLRKLFPQDHALHKQQWTFDQFVEAAQADLVLDELIEAAKAPAAKDTSGKE